VKLPLTKEENQESSINLINIDKILTIFEAKIGKLCCVIGGYKSLSRAMIPINENYYLIVTIDFEENDFDKIIMEKIIPLIKNEKREILNTRIEFISYFLLVLIFL
jgi:hypothetical protein